MSNKHVLQETLFADTQQSMDIYYMHHRIVAADWSFHHHKHNTIELLAVFEGEKYVGFIEEEVLLQAGDVLIIRPGSVHHCWNAGDQPMEYFTLHAKLDDYFLNSLFACRPWHKLSQQGASCIHSKLRHLLDSNRSSRRTASIARMHQQAAVMEVLAAAAESILETSSMDELPSEQSAKAIRIAAFLEEWISRRSLSDGHSASRDWLRCAADELKLSKSQCNRIFTQVYGIPPREYYSSILLKAAKQRLAQPEDSIEEIAYQLGYTAPAHFSRQFKRWTGLSPKAWREREQT
ncbi:helix-turn-helix domain-containing protein [Paenibacillus sp. GCM10023252]|uniref:AraC family transcriptional regulator n=1 Tax=Paenibacillus sp. GCM10023252 TaxID=3252649 RepID=UPI003615909F